MKARITYKKRRGWVSPQNSRKVDKILLETYASSVGAKTVKGPSLERVSVRPAWTTAVTRVLWTPFPIATSTIVFWATTDGSIRAAAKAAGLKDIMLFVCIFRKKRKIDRKRSG